MPNFAKIRVTTNDADWHGVACETLWGSVVKDGVLRVENNPLYAYGISYHDIVQAVGTGDDLFEFARVIVKGGHSNYRVLLKAGMTRAHFNEIWPRIGSLGCAYESSTDPENVFAIDVPPESDVDAVFRILEEAENAGIWYLDEGNFEHNRGHNA